MVVVRCARKLLDRLGHGRPRDVSSTTTLEEWYATILFTRQQQVVLLVNALTRLAVVTHGTWPRYLSGSRRGWRPC